MRRSQRKRQFDLATLPVETAAAELRILARWSMQQLYAPDGQEMPSLEFWHRWLSPKAARLWHGSTPRPAQRKFRKHQRWAEKKAITALSQENTPVPDMFLALSAATAWAHPTFELDAWRFTRRRIETQMIFDTQFEKHLGFNISTFWLIIALAMDAQIQGLKRPPLWPPRHWGPDHRKDTMKRLRDLGLSRAKRRRHWAGFWDQWLITEAMLVTSKERQQVWIKRFPALERLPLLRIRFKLTPARLPMIEGTWEIHRPDWLDYAPAPLLERYGYLMRPPPLS